MLAYENRIVALLRSVWVVRWICEQNIAATLYFVRSDTYDVMNTNLCCRMFSKCAVDKICIIRRVITVHVYLQCSECGVRYILSY